MERYFCLVRQRFFLFVEKKKSCIATGIDISNLHTESQAKYFASCLNLAERMFMFLLGHCGTSFVSYIPNKFHFQGLTWVFLQLKKKMATTNTIFLISSHVRKPNIQLTDDLTSHFQTLYFLCLADRGFDQSPFPQTDWLSLFQNICDRNSTDNSGKHLTRCAWLQNPGVIILQVNVVKTPAASDQIKPVCQLFLDSLLPA